MLPSMRTQTRRITEAHDDEAHGDHHPAAQGSRAAELVTSRASRRLRGPFLGVVLPGGVRGGRSLHRPGLRLDPLRLARRRLVAAHRHADRGDARRRQHRVVARAHLLDRLHGARPAPAALLRLSLVLHLRHADAGDGEQPRADVLRLGGRRPRLLPPDRLLVRPPLGECRGDQGLRGQPRRRLRLRARHFRRLLSLRLDRPRHDLRQRVGGGGEEGRRPQHLRLCARWARRDHRRRAASLHGRDGKIRAGAAPHLASRRHGRPDAGLRA